MLDLNVAESNPDRCISTHCEWVGGHINTTTYPQEKTVLVVWSTSWHK
jgi:hypothetical protein